MKEELKKDINKILVSYHRKRDDNMLIQVYDSICHLLDTKYKDEEEYIFKLTGCVNIKVLADNYNKYKKYPKLWQHFEEHIENEMLKGDERYYIIVKDIRSLMQKLKQKYIGDGNE